MSYFAVDKPQDTSAVGLLKSLHNGLGQLGISFERKGRGEPALGILNGVPSTYTRISC